MKIMFLALAAVLGLALGACSPPPCPAGIAGLPVRAGSRP